MVVETAVAAGAEITETVVAEAAEAAVVEGVSVSGATELSETLSAIQKEIPQEVIGERVDALLQDEAFRAEILDETRLADLKEQGLIRDFSEHCRYETTLPEDRYLGSDYQQFKHCNEQLGQAYENGTLDTEQFTDRQLEQIRNGDKPEGYTWHHHEEPGRMQLVDSEIHAETRHVGGRYLWGGGSEAR